MADEPLKNILSLCSDGDFGSIVQRARELGELTNLLSQALPEEFSGAVVAANVRENGELVVIAASSAWASRLRFETDALQSAALEAGLTVTACRIRVSSV